jgi:hypothetical protein
LLTVLRTRHPRIHDWPAPSTVADLLARRGLVQKRRHRRASTHPGVVRPTTAAPNDLWTADFKGQFRTGDRRYCYPLTQLRCIPRGVQHGASARTARQQTPASQYTASVRPYRERLPPLEYPRHFVVKKITTGGTFRFQHKLLYLANAMVDQHIGLEETDDGIWAIHFNTVLLATFGERDYIISG